MQQMKMMHLSSGMRQFKKTVPAPLVADDNQAQQCNDANKQDDKNKQQTQKQPQPPAAEATTSVPNANQDKK